MLNKINLENVLFLDIETVPEAQDFDDLTAEKQALWAKKSQYQRKEDFSPKAFYPRAGIWAEFGKIICISVGHFILETDSKKFRITTFTGKEKKLLLEFKELLDKHFNGRRHLLCAHNGKEFDFPFIARRMLIHKIELPSKLNLFGKKPWEIPHLDTLELWKFGDYKSFTSLPLLCNIFNVPTPKDDISGADVARVYYEENDLERIKVYCEKDVVALIQVFLKFRGDALVEEDNVKYS